MSALDEDTLTTATTVQDDDPSEETQDFRFLSSLSSSVILDSNQKLPKRGDKDFEANATRLQANTLDASRQAMHDALSHTRYHNPKNHVVAVYDPQTGGAWVEKAKGILFNAVGTWRKDRPSWTYSDAKDAEDEKQAGGLWLRPEEALHMLERGSLDVRWPPVTESKGTAERSQGLPMSLQGAYAAFIGLSQPGQLTLEEYIVYGGLKRGGFTVVRAEHSPSKSTSRSTNAAPLKGAQVAPPSSLASFWQRLFTRGPNHPTGRVNFGPLVTPGLYRNYSDIYRLLSVVPYHDPTKREQHSNTSTPSLSEDTLIDGSSRLHVTYHVYKASTPYSKRAPPPPDFNIIVLSARQTTLPTLVQLDDLMSRLPYDPPADDRLYQKLKHGYRNILLAIVDQGITSYVRLSDAGFGCQKIYDSPRPRGGKRGRGGRGRGRGGGRGGGKG